MVTDGEFWANTPRTGLRDTYSFFLSMLKILDAKVYVPKHKLIGRCRPSLREFLSLAKMKDVLRNTE